MEEKIDLIAQKIKASKRLIVFTGAGISTESGIPDYRSQGGLWTKFQPIYFDEFMSSKDARIRYWERHLHMGRSLMTSKPNKGHDSITALYTHGFLNTVITQNIDGLHQKSGIPDKDVIELHGNATRVRCMSCRCLFSWEAALEMIKQGNTPPECECSGYLKPDTISFGQSMPVKETQKAEELSSQSDVFIVVGSTLIVQPAALMPKYAKDNGAFLAIINLSETPYDSVCDVLIREKAGTVLEQIAQKVLRN